MGSTLNFRGFNLWDLVNPLTADPFLDYSQYLPAVQKEAPINYTINSALMTNNSDPIPPEILPKIEGAYALAEDPIKMVLEANILDFTQDRIEYDIFLDLL